MKNSLISRNSLVAETIPRIKRARAFFVVVKCHMLKDCFQNILRVNEHSRLLLSYFHFHATSKIARTLEIILQTFPAKIHKKITFDSFFGLCNIKERHLEQSSINSSQKSFRNVTENFLPTNSRV